jgi:hypothetical protein
VVFVAIRVEPMNAGVIKQNLDLTILDIFSGEPRYLVDGFEGPVSYMILDELSFFQRWRFRVAELEGAFTEVVPSAFFKGVQ